MARLLVIEASPRGESSVSRQLSASFVEQWLNMHTDEAVTRRDLVTQPLPYLSADWLTAYFTPPPVQTEAMKAQLALSDQLVEELLAADHLLISTPVYNYNIPANLKSWVDHIVRKGLTLGFDGKGLVKGKKATVVIASGGVYSEGSPIAERDIASQYLKLILEVLGFEDIQIIAGGGAKAVDLGEMSMSAFIESHQSALAARAAV
ncbi:FMN-dependent NADH-azoreductase [Pokkaliibacter sp. CJK22405]|uniref:FMN-dependent NADH-azoreductase n=1 Tax=Pokkaliibacter sp. CJK22405 TaxID=3384615 RepID=UPI0039854814